MLRGGVRLHQLGQLIDERIAEPGHSIEIVARQTGFSDRDHMRRAFLRAFGQPPQVLRRHARLEAIDDPQRAGNG